MALDDTTRHFLALLHRGGQYGYWWTLEGRQSFWWEVGKMTPLPGGRRNVYVGVHPTTAIPETNPRGEQAPARHVRAQLAYIAAINCLYCEYDAKDYGGDKAAAKDAAEAMQPAPSVIIDSGGGYHVYHLLDEPWLLKGDADRTHARRLQAAWVAYAGSDPQVKDLARVLRVPETLNYKYTPPRPVTFLLKQFDRRYRREELEQVCAHLMEAERLPSVAPQQATDPEDRQKRYALGALDREVANVLRAQPGQKHDTIRNAALKLGTFVPRGLLTEDQIIDELTRAADIHRDDVKDTYRTVLDGIAYGKQRPRDIPDRAKRPPTERRVDPATGEILDPPAPQEYVVDWRQQGITLRQLQHKYFDPERWIIERILPEGACLFAAKYKSRKSWIALALGLAIAMGGKALGQLETHPGRVLYLDLEGRQQRIKKRTRAILGVQQVDWPDNFHVFTKWPMADEGLREIEQWFSSYPDTVYVVLDVLGDFRRPIEKHEMGYAYDRVTVQPLNELFERYHACGLLVHHFNKAKNDDIMDSISGTTGLPSAVNTMWGLARDPNDSNITILHLRGRDLEDDEPIALRWDSYLNMHVIEGPAREVSISGERKAIMQLLGDDEPRTPKEIAAALGKPVAAIQFLLRKLLNDGLIDKPSYGKYAVIALSTLSTQSTQSAQSAQTERQVPTLSGTQKTAQSSVEPQKAINANSEHSERVIRGDVHASINEYERANAEFWQGVIANGQEVTVNPEPDDPFFASVPPSKRTYLRLYLRSNQERDQERARELCQQYGLDYEQARREAA